MDGGDWLASRHGRFIPGVKAPQHPVNKRWVVARAGLDMVAKSKIPARTGNRTPVVQLVAYTD